MQRALEEKEDAVVVAISPAEPALLRSLRDSLGLRVVLLSDPSWSTYRAYGLERGSSLRLLLSPGLWFAYARLLARGRRPSRPAEDVLELGGDVIVDRDGRIAWIHRPRGITDRPRAAELARRLAAL